MSTHVKIVKDPDVLYGKPRFEGTRIGVFMVGESIRRGEHTIESILDGHPDLTREQVDAGLDYYDDHPEAMDVIRQRKEANRRRVQRQSRAPGVGEQA